MYALSSLPLGGEEWWFRPPASSLPACFPLLRSGLCHADGKKGAPQDSLVLRFPQLGAISGRRVRSRVNDAAVHDVIPDRPNQARDLPVDQAGEHCEDGVLQERPGMVLPRPSIMQAMSFPIFALPIRISDCLLLIAG